MIAELRKFVDSRIRTLQKKRQRPGRKIAEIRSEAKKKDLGKLSF